MNNNSNNNKSKLKAPRKELRHWFSHHRTPRFLHAPSLQPYCRGGRRRRVGEQYFVGGIVWGLFQLWDCVGIVSVVGLCGDCFSCGIVWGLFQLWDCVGIVSVVGLCGDCFNCLMPRRWKRRIQIQIYFW